MKSLSIVIPAKNESAAIGDLIKKLANSFGDAQIIVVDDGSTDNTAEVAKAAGAEVISHNYSMGNGAAIKTGARVAEGDALLFMDGDGQHDPDDIPNLIKRYLEGYDMVVGNRDSKSQASFGRLAANRIYNSLASWMVGHRIRDLTSGFRLVNAKKFKEFLYLLPNGFSYPTTSTMAFFKAGYSVCYEAINVKKRKGDSHINIIKDGMKFLLIIFKVGTLYSPLKLFSYVSAFLFLTGVGFYFYTYLTMGRFTNMGVLLILSSIMIFMIGLVSEQVSALIYKR